MSADADIEYPPQPWRLHGRAHGSLWRIPRQALPALAGPVTPLTFRGHAFAITAFVHYDARSPLAYREFLVAILVRHRLRLGLTITDIWVDSPSSLAGGRNLWAIPKESGTFTTQDTRTTVTAEDSSTIAAVLGSGSSNHRFPLLVMTSVWQSRGSELVRAPVRVVGRISLATTTWHTPWPARLAWLPRHPITSCEIPDFAMRFGARHARQAVQTPP